MVNNLSPEERSLPRSAGFAETGQADGKPGVGAVLREARMQQGGRPVEDIARELRIRPHLLEALEADDYDKLPGLIYAAGFLRSYAHYLGLDGADLVERLKQSGRTRALEAQLVFPEPLADPRIPRRPLVIAACAMALAVYGAWYGYASQGGGDFDRVPAPPPEFAEMARERAGEAAPEQMQPPVSAPAQTPQGSDALGKDIPTLSGQSDPAPGTRTADATPVAAGKTRGNGAQGGQALSATEAERITVKARSDAWVRIEGPDSTPLVDRVLKAGDAVDAPYGSGFVMMTGNAGALDVVVDGKTIGPLGPVGEVRHHVALDQFVFAGNMVRSQ